MLNTLPKKTYAAGVKPLRAIWVFLAMYATGAPTSFSVQASIPSRVLPSPVGSSHIRDPIIKVFIRDLDAHVVPGSVRLFLGQMELTPLVIADKPDGVEAEYRQRPTLPVDSMQTVSVVFRDDDPLSRTLTNTWSFTVGPLTHDTLFIEAEDFNFSNDGVAGGLHANFGDPDCSLIGKDGVHGVDYYEVDGSNDYPLYRAPTGVEAARPGIDTTRGERVMTCNYIVGWNDVGDWFNYTRAFAPHEQAFMVYLRAASVSASQVRLDRVEGAESTNQVVTSLGTFQISPSVSSNVFGFYPLRVENSNSPLVRLCGRTTFRLTVIEGNLDLNYLALVSASGEFERSMLSSIYPAPLSDYARAPTIKAVFSNLESAVIPSSIKLFFDCQNVTAQSTVTDLPAGAMVCFQAPEYSPVSMRHFVRVEWQDTRHCGLPPQVYEWTYLEGYYNPDKNLFIEAEDFDANGGRYFPSNPATTNEFNRKGLYQDATAIHDVDYHFQDQGTLPRAYRAGLNPEVGMREANDLGMGERPGFEQSLDYRIGWNTSGNWYNYTRYWSYPPLYNVYLRASHGVTNTPINADLSIVHSNGSAQSLGTFSGLATGNWDVFGFIPLRDAGGGLASVQLAGQCTLRYTVLPGIGLAADFNYLMFVPRSTIVDYLALYLRKCDLDGLVYLGFRGRLETSDSITGPWSLEPNLTSPTIVPLSVVKQKFWRVID